MAEQVEEKIIFTGDASQLQNAFDVLVNDISRTREELKQYKDDKEKTAELSKQLADQEMKLVQVMQKADNQIDASNVSYKQLNDILKDLNKTYKNTADEAQRLNLAPSIKAINSELKGMDANIGNFQRNVGNYEGAITSAANSMSRSFINLAKTLPSLENGPEQFFMQLAQQLPNIIGALDKLNEAREAASVAASKDATTHRAEAGEAAESMEAHQAETGAVLQSAAAHIEEAEALVEVAKREVEVAKASVVAAQAKKNDIIETKAKVAVMQEELAKKIDLNASDKQLIIDLETLNRLRAQDSQLTIDLAIATSDLTAAEIGLENAEKKLAAAEKVLDEQRKQQTAGGALKGLVKTLFSWQTAILAVIMVMAIWGKDIIKWFKNLKMFNDEAKKAARFQKEWNALMKEGHQNAAKQVVDLKIYSQWATMSAKSDKERTLAAKEVLKTMGSAVTQTNIAKVKNGEFAKSIDEVTKALIRQAQAEAMTSKITEKYKDVIDAMDKKAKAESGELDWTARVQGAAVQQYSPGYSSTVGAPGMGYSAQQNEELYKSLLEDTKKRAEENLKKAQGEFDKWLENFLKNFNPSDLLFGKGGSGGNGDNWFSKWELYIKEFEATLIKFQGEYEELDFASIWKYSAEGLKYYTKMYDEYIEHYSADEKALREAQVNKMKYINEFNEYHKKLQKQYLDSLKTEKQVELDKLEEWYTVQKKVYENAGEDTTALTAEYEKRKQDIIDKYVDKYRNAMIEKAAIAASVDGNVLKFNEEMMNLELANLEDTHQKELAEYKRKGIETVNLEEHYAQERKKIISKYAKEETDAIIGQIQVQEDALKRRNDQMLAYKNMGGANFDTEKLYASLGGTTITGHQQRQNEINATQTEKNIFEDSMQKQIEAMESVLESDKLIGEERLAVQAQLENARMELALGTSEYQLKLNEMVLEDTRATTDEWLSGIQSGAQGMATLMDDVYGAIEKNLQAKVAEGKMTNEEAEKQLEEYKGIKAAAAAMDALSSAVGAYNSLASIPYVGPVLGAAAAAAALAAGFANVKMIMATTKDNAGSGTDSYANAMPSLSDYQPQYVTNVTGKDDTDYLANALNEKPIQAFVVESEVTAGQELANKRTNETTW